MKFIIALSTLLFGSLLFGAFDSSKAGGSGVHPSFKEPTAVQTNIHALHWGDFEPKNCVAPGLRQYSSRLWDIQGNWNAVCNSTPADINGYHFDKPSRCKDLGAGGEWGEFDVPDNTCLSYWDPFKADQCVANGVRQYSAQLRRVPAGVTWEAACDQTGATILGQVFNKPDRCEIPVSGGMWGEFNVQDSSCLSQWESFKADDCVANGVRQYSAQLLVPTGLSWEASCAVAGATIYGQEFTQPTRCVNTGATGMWGEFAVKDNSCLPQWDTFKADACVEYGVRQYSAQLLVPSGLPWDAACEVAGATIHGQVFDKPSRCVNTGITGMWGEFDVKDDSCLPAWDTLKEDACVALDVRQYSAQLLVPAGFSWEAACEITGATIHGQVFDKPSRCVNTGLTGMWGEFDVPDTTCRPTWGAFQRDQCTGYTKRQYSAILWNIPPTLAWERTCALMGATVAGKEFSAPSRCVNTVLNEWGQFDVTDYVCLVEYPVTQILSWQTLVALGVILLLAVGLFALWLRFFPKKKA